MRVVIQRVREASLTIDGEPSSQMGVGFVILVGVENADTEADAEWLAKKMSGMRLFTDADGKMNLSIQEVGGSLMVVSQFTLHASTKKGNRPSFLRAGDSSHAEKLYEYLIECLRRSAPDVPMFCGRFGADMQVSLINDGPVTILMDTLQKE